MGFWDNYDNQKKTKSFWDDYDKIDVVKPTFTQRMTGTPVQQKDGTFKATTGVTDVLTELPFVGPFARMGKTLGETLAYNKLDDNTRESLAKSGEVDNVVPDLKRKNSEIAFDAGEAILDAVTGGISGLYRKGSVNTLKLSPLKVRNLADLKLTRNQILKRLGIETGVNTGAAYGYEVGQNVKEDKKGIQALKPGVGTPLTAILTAVMGSKGATDLSNKITQNNIVSKYAQKFNVPEVGVPYVKLESPQMRETRVQQEIANRSNLPVNKLPSGETIPLQEKGILDAQRRLNETPKVETPDIIKKPEILRAEKFNSRQDFINNEMDFYKRTKQPIPKNIVEKSAKIWDEAHTTPKQQPLAPLPKQEIPTQPLKQEVPTQPRVDTPKQAVPEQSPISNTPEFKSKVSEGETVLNNSNPDIAPGTHKMYSETVYSDIANDPERVMRIAMGSGEQTTNGVPADAYYAIAKNEAVKSGDVQAMKDLANSNVGSISGQKLEANKLTQEGDIIDTLRDIKKARTKAVGVSEEAIKKQETTFVQKLKVSVKNLSDDIINDLICK